MLMITYMVRSLTTSTVLIPPFLLIILQHHLAPQPHMIVIQMVLPLPPEILINLLWTSDYTKVCLFVSGMHLVLSTNCQPFVYSSSLDIIAITESWLSGQILDKELLPTGYQIVCTDRSSCGGYVMFAIHNSIPATCLSSPSHLKVVTVRLQHKVYLILCLVCISPQSCDNYYISLFDYLHGILSSDNKLILLNDFNFPNINWNSLSGHSCHSTRFCDLI